MYKPSFSKSCTERQLQQMVDEIFDDVDDIDECSDANDESFVIEEFSEHSSSEPEYDTQSELGEDVNSGSCSSRDKSIVWSLSPTITERSRVTRENIIPGKPGITHYAVHRIASVKESFDLCFTKQMKKIVIEFSNMEGTKRNPQNFKMIDEIEFDAYLGVLILAGVYRSHGESLCSLWNEMHGRPIFRSVMSKGRFSEINSVLRFDDKDKRRSLRTTDKLAPIRDLYEKWVANLPYLFAPYENVTVDERLIPFKGRCPFMVYMPSKPHKYGLKAWVAADVRTKFCLNFQIYLGKESINSQPERNQGQRVVLDLVSSYQGRNVTTDNFSKTYDLTQELFKRNITLVGTVRNNRRFLPVCSTKKEDRKLPVFSSRFFFSQKVSLVQYIPKKYKIVTVLSTMHLSEDVISSNPKQLPEVISYYNCTKGGVDTIDQLVETYSSKRQTKRWPVALFSNIIDISALNGFVLWTEVNPEWNSSKTYKRRLYLEELGLALAYEHMKRRERVPRSQASASIVQRIRIESEQRNTSTTDPTRKRKASQRVLCTICPAGKRLSTVRYVELQYALSIGLRSLLQRLIAETMLHKP